MQSNILQFNEFAIAVLSYLYNRFPAASPLQLDSLIGGEIHEETLEACPKVQFAEHVVRWLEIEGLIKTGSNGHFSFSDCVLTAKGLSFLHKKDNETELTTIKKLKDCQSKACFKCFDPHF